MKSIIVLLFAIFFIVCPAWSSDINNKDIAQLRVAAEKGDSKAQYILGSRYYYGKGIPQD